MAVVYLAHDRRHDRPVALKLLHPELSATLGPERFLREIKLTAALQHPHILPVFDSGEAADRLWYAMPYIEGESLRDRLRREVQLPLAEALTTVKEVADALSHAHLHGIVHRDVKPENILLSRGQAFLADFGVARALDAAAYGRLTETGLALGTPSYMSPEQAAADGRLDARSDIYALGCVLFEMLAGQPPYTGPTAQSILARHAVDPVPSVRTVRSTVPQTVEDAITRALAKVPADRFATAAEFAQALTLPARHSRLAAGKTRRLWIVTVGAFALAAGAGALLVRSHTPVPSTLDADLVAVTPFDVVVPALHPWSEGLVDVLSRSLDGAGPLRTVSPTFTLKRWTGRADPISAAALGHRAGAGLVVFGALERSGRDSVRLRAEMLDLRDPSAHREVEVRGDTLRMDRLIDSLAVSLLRELGRTRPVGAVRQSPLGAHSLPALKAFLRGEQLYRRAQWDSALVQYDDAITLDSTFALAHQRMAWVGGWLPPSHHKYKSGEEYGRLASAFNHGLAPRDSMLIVVHTAQATVFDAVGSDTEHPDYFADKRRLLATLAEAQRRYPGDPEFWYASGESRWHANDPVVATNEEALDAFDRAIALDSGFAPAYYHLPGIAIAADLGDPTRARHYLAAFSRLNLEESETSSLRFAATLLDPEQARLPQTRRLIETAHPHRLFGAALEFFDAWPDSTETAVRLLRSLVASHHRSRDWSDPIERRRMLAFALTQRGHLREAYQLQPPFVVTERWWNPYIRLALLGAVPVDTAADVFRRALEADLSTGVAGLILVLPWWFAQHDTTALKRFVSRLDSLPRHDPAEPVHNSRQRYAAESARAYLTLLRGDSAGALRVFATLPDSTCGLVSCYAQKLTEARLLQAVGEDRRAIALLERWIGITGDLSVPDPMAVLELARLAETLGERDKALKSYRFVANTWRRSDSELQPYVEEARNGLVRLTGEPQGP